MCGSITSSFSATARRSFAPEVQRNRGVSLSPPLATSDDPRASTVHWRGNPFWIWRKHSNEVEGAPDPASSRFASINLYPGRLYARCSSCCMWAGQEIGRRRRTLASHAVAIIELILCSLAGLQLGRGNLDDGRTRGLDQFLEYRLVWRDLHRAV
jgi:hypothetical protein